MTAKQTRILEVATKLFSQDGFAATSTAKIAQVAAVSEGLIFRHFKNKQGLLDAIAAQSNLREREDLDRLEAITDPAERIQSAIDAAFAKRKKDAVYDALKTQLNAVNTGFGESQTKAFEKILSDAFAALDYDDALIEARFLRCSLDGIRRAIADDNLTGAKKMKSFVKAMYA